MQITEIWLFLLLVILCGLLVLSYRMFPDVTKKDTCVQIPENLKCLQEKIAELSVTEEYLYEELRKGFATDDYIGHAARCRKQIVQVKVKRIHTTIKYNLYARRSKIISNFDTLNKTLFAMREEMLTSEDALKSLLVRIQEFDTSKFDTVQYKNLLKQYHYIKTKAEILMDTRDALRSIYNKMKETGEA